MDRCSYMDESAANSEGYADTEVVGSLSLPLAQQDLQVESRADTPLEQPASAGHARKNFAAAADAILLRAVNALMKSFDKVANICEEVEGFVRDKHGPALRTHFDKIVRQHRDAEVVSRRASGTVEEYDERDMLLQDITPVWMTSNSFKPLKKIFGAPKGLDASVEWVSLKTSCKSGDNASATSTGSKKRTIVNSNGRATKVTKLERVSAVTDAIALAITEMNKGDPQKYAFLNSRLQFEKEEAEKAREHEIKMELHRQEAQRARDERLLAAERERENFMMS
ncbi:hypothetical protein GQ600_6227 [Phytophthora cactorum]|nr:hypothetical protein GQ600_6227 [Phytophthora cactorum]